jgi:uncharacterized protein
MKAFKKLLFLVLASILILPVQAATLRNQLKHHPSAYLALHGSDPVAWQKWSPAVMQRARRENKLVYLSIGYFSCHWCHVMQRETYKNPRIAGFINRHFIPVKIDRELEPALDSRMIDFAEATLNRAGWPLNVFITPEGYPLYAMLYLKPDDFLSETRKLQILWQKDPKALMQLARRGTSKSTGPGRPQLKLALVRQHIQRVVNQAVALEDPLAGGFGDQGKFPSVPQLDFLLLYQQHFPNPKVKKILLLTLDEMAKNGLQDHLGGGFFRYTVDSGWQTPHFEKMLYDNALLARLYFRAATVLKKPGYAVIGHRTLGFMTREMRLPSGGLMASFSAIDNKNVEGGYYLWSKAQLKGILSSQEMPVYVLAARIQDHAPFPQGYLPMQGAGSKEIARALRIDRTSVQRLLRSAKNKLIKARQKRILPRDRKVLAGWNGLTLSAYAQAARSHGKGGRYRQTADGIRRYILQKLWTGARLHRSVYRGRPVGSASLEDYAFVARGLYDWALLTNRRQDYLQAKKVVDQAWQRYYGKTGWRQNDRSLIQAETGRDVLTDGPLPAPSGELIDVSLKLAKKLNDKTLRTRALAAMNSGHDIIEENAFWYATHVKAMLNAMVSR